MLDTIKALFMSEDFEGLRERRSETGALVRERE